MPVSAPRQRLLAATLAALAVCADASAKECNVTSTPLSFGVYDMLSSIPVTGISVVRVTCLPAQRPFVVEVTVSPPSGGVSRAMTSVAGDRLIYDIYEDPTYTVPFVSYSQLVSRPDPWTVSLYGKILPFQNLPSGQYSDTITVTLLY